MSKEEALEDIIRVACFIEWQANCWEATGNAGAAEAYKERAKRLRNAVASMRLSSC